MANWVELISEINTYIRTNGSESITGQTLNAILIKMVNMFGTEIDGLALGKFYGFFPDTEDLPEGDDPGYAYVGSEPPFSVYCFDGVTWVDSGAVFSPAEGNGEDIDTDSSGKLQFANRTGNDGKGYVILRQGETVSSQMASNNTIYEIRYDFDNIGEVTIPSGSILRFNGGKLSGGTVIGTDTIIEAKEVEIFSGVTIGGTWNVTNIFACWFEKDANTVRNALALNNDSIHTNIIISGDYNTEVLSTIRISGNTDIFLTGTIKKTATSTPNVAMFSIYGNNINIVGGVIDGNKSAFDTSSEYGHGVNISSGVSNIGIYGTSIIDCRGDGLYVGGANAAKNINICGCTISGCRRNGVSVIHGQNIAISSCSIININGTDPGAAVDIEPNSSGQINRHVTIKDCDVSGCFRGITISGANETIYDVTIDGCVFSLNGYKVAISMEKALGVVVTDCDFNLQNNSSTYDFTGASISTIYPVFKNCKIISTTTTTGYLFSSFRFMMENCNIDSGRIAFQTFSACIKNSIIVCGKKLTDYFSSSRYLVKEIIGCRITAKGIVLSGRSSSSYANNIVIENNYISSDSADYPVLGNYVKNARIVGNVFYVKGAGRAFNFAYGENVTISNNNILIGSNYDVIYFTSSHNCRSKDNVFEIEDGVTFSSLYYRGINNTSSSAANQKGDSYFNESYGKIIVFTGTSWVNADGTSLS